MIFLSYSWQYADAARRLDDLLRGRGHPVWIDFRDLDTRHELTGEIDRAIGNCSLFLMLRHVDARPTPWMEAEWQMASLHGKPIIEHMLIGAARKSHKFFLSAPGRAAGASWPLASKSIGLASADHGRWCFPLRRPSPLLESSDLV